MADDPDAISLSTLPPYTSSRPPSYNPAQEPPKAYTFTPIERSMYEPPPALSSPTPEHSPTPSPSPSRPREYLKHATQMMRPYAFGILLIVLWLLLWVLAGASIWLALKKEAAKKTR